MSLFTILRLLGRGPLEAMQEKKEMLVTSISNISDIQMLSIYIRCCLVEFNFPLTNPYPIDLSFILMIPAKKNIENIEGREENAAYEHFHLFSQCFQFF